VDQGQQLAAWPVRTRPLAQVDRRIGGLLDAEPLGQRGRQQQAALATAWVSSKQMSSWSRVWEDPIENVPSWSGITAAVAGAMLPGQRGLSRNRTSAALGLGRRNLPGGPCIVQCPGLEGVVATKTPQHDGTTDEPGSGGPS
jgi:hypothetical protein